MMPVIQTPQISIILRKQIINSNQTKRLSTIKIMLVVNTKKRNSSTAQKLEKQVVDRNIEIRPVLPRLRLIVPPRPQESSDAVNSSDLSLSSQSLENLTRDNTVRNSTLQSELNGNFWRLVPINIDSVDDKIIQY
jgi:hypothetical protein